MKGGARGFKSLRSGVVSVEMGVEVLGSWDEGEEGVLAAARAALYAAKNWGLMLPY